MIFEQEEYNKNIFETDITERKENVWKAKCLTNGPCFTKGDLIIVENGKVTSLTTTTPTFHKSNFINIEVGTFKDFKSSSSELWKLIIEIKDFTKSDLQECDVVVLRNEERHVYFDNTFLSNYNVDKRMEYYGDNLVRNDETNECDVMQVYRNNELIFERIEKTERQIEIEKLKENIKELEKRIEEMEKENL